MTDLALSVLDRPPRRRQARAREHARGVSPRCATRPHLLRMRREALARRRAVPDARRRVAAHDGAARAWAVIATGPSFRGSTQVHGTARPYAGEPLPTLERIANFIRANGFLINLEIKPTPGTEAETGRVVAEHVRRLWAGAEVAPLLSSFRPESLLAAMQAAPELPRGLLLDEPWTGWASIAAQLRVRRDHHQPPQARRSAGGASTNHRTAPVGLHRERARRRGERRSTGRRRHHHRRGRSFRAHASPPRALTNADSDAVVANLQDAARPAVGQWRHCPSTASVPP